ncbi:RagB/SusD family nutrient uptake outer membrane protein [Parapedobacter sp. DT-150]|uniref:RagB/SusD family nutrient uptake outer membrane protein n=1 Tax=Parapedobacter sp. DT-150 TaxID=3396162 RepID=UPI003F1A2B34
MKKSIIYIAASLGLLVSQSCSDFLETEPFDKLVPSSFFATEEDLQLYTNSFYQQMLPSADVATQGDGMADYSSITQSSNFISGNYSSVNEGAWNWTDLRNINYFLANYNNEAIPEEARNHYAGIARFFRAWFYIDKVQRYGNVPWYDAPLATDDEALYKTQDPREVVMQHVLEDLNFAAENIRDAKDNTSSTITRQVALAYKSRIALYEGTYRKYHAELGLAATADQWLTEAANAAKMVMDAGTYSLYNTGNPTTDYRTLFISENAVSQEVLFALVFNNALKRWHALTWKFNSATYGARWGLNKQFINTYLMTDGSRFTDKAGYDELLFVDEMANRDNRLAQTVRSLGYKRSDGSAAPPNFGYTFTGYHLLKWSMDDKRLDGIGEAYNTIPLMRFAEVLLNYAEAKAELGQFDEAVWAQTIGLLRERAGVNVAVPQTADPYLREVYFPEISDRYLLEIRRERGIELCYENLRYQDLMRWKKGKLVEMPWKGIYVPAMDRPMDLDGNGTPDVSFVSKTPDAAQPGVTYFVIDNNISKLTGGTSGHVIWGANEKRSFEDKKYLYPISNSDIVLNPALVQNPGWE